MATGVLSAGWYSILTGVVLLNVAYLLGSVSWNADRAASFVAVAPAASGLWQLERGLRAEFRRRPTSTDEPQFLPDTSALPRSARAADERTRAGLARNRVRDCEATPAASWPGDQRPGRSFRTAGALCAVGPSGGWRVSSGPRGLVDRLLRRSGCRIGSLAPPAVGEARSGHVGSDLGGFTHAALRGVAEPKRTWTVCKQSTNFSSCAEQWNPLPWLVSGLGCLVAGLVAFYVLGRTHRVA